MYQRFEKSELEKNQMRAREMLHLFRTRTILFIVFNRREN